ncbi:DUF3667 domain-containing protein [Paraurantiacibacter namhicola]|uniref:DUF3667 domain-containing protein n=1 Tax=Paraurantiacibacter namhicola TaxID=645517 RepID=A0A1C7D517_9SPHN|nr:DUF3667 domain-containing protein [Paraurantiacibacter namhicola]ANU06421.1 hypothetical protein A6F65_00093 [Paraurantiacibacter namhicola]
MSDITDGIGTAIEGGVLARVVEPDASGHPVQTPLDEGGHWQEKNCLNCETPLKGAHCHNCGQRAHLHRTLGAFFHDLMHGVLHFEGKLWRTLPKLAWQPGKLTREYIDGKRARYISPIALFLFVIFITFALISLAGGIGKIEQGPDIATEDEVIETVAEIDRRVEDFSTTIDDPETEPARAAELREEIATLQAERVFFAKLAEMYQDGEIPVEPELQFDPATDPSAAEWINTRWKEAKANPNLLIYKLQTNSYKLSWLLIPLSLPFMWLLFPFSRKFRLYDHTVFVTYSIAFMTFLLVLVSVLGAFELQPLILIPMLYAPFHLYRHLKGTYGLSRFGAIWRVLVLSSFIWIVMASFVMLMTALVLT